MAKEKNINRDRIATTICGWSALLAIGLFWGWFATANNIMYWGGWTFAVTAAVSLCFTSND